MLKLSLSSLTELKAVLGSDASLDPLCDQSAVCLTFCATHNMGGYECL